MGGGGVKEKNKNKKTTTQTQKFEIEKTCFFDPFTSHIRRTKTPSCYRQVLSYYHGLQIKVVYLELFNEKKAALGKM